MRLLGLTLVLLIAAGVGGGCAASKPAGPPPAARVGPTIEADHGVVVSVCPIASRVGCEVLRDGGNAVDAAVATAFALAVTWPEAGNIGGGGFMLVHGGPRKVSEFVDYRETAPAAVTATSFANKPSQHALAGTPGTVQGLYYAHLKFGSGRIPWKDLVLPAVRLAADGFEVNAALAASLNSGLRGVPADSEFRRVYGRPDGGEWRAGDRLVLPDLGKTLERIANHNAFGFYQERTAQLIVDEMKRGGGLITADDLSAYKPVFRRPITSTYRGYTVVAPPPPSSGGIAMLQILGMLEARGATGQPRWSPAVSHLYVEAARRAFAERARYLGDPDFTTVPVGALLAPDHVAKMARSIASDRAAPTGDPVPWLTHPDGATGGQTTHFSVVDKDGMAVANTYTLEQSFGGKVVVKEAGFLLNNELGDFNPVPGTTDTTGKIGTPPNVAAPGKRPLSSMTPTIVTDASGKVVLVAGSPGGRTIINTVTQVVLNRLGFGMSLRDAVDAPRLHHQWLPDGVRAEKAFEAGHADVVQAMKAMGHTFDPKPAARQGDAHSIEVDPKTGKKTGVADQRIGG
ncbi:MAG TPA: gamma-glutamyltransferase, partial [Humisphaera sp.]